MTRRFRIRRVGSKGKSVSVLTVPAEIASRVDPDQEFLCEATEEGILYRPVKPIQPEIPEWIKRQHRSGTEEQDAGERGRPNSRRVRKFQPPEGLAGWAERELRG